MKTVFCNASYISAQETPNVKSYTKSPPFSFGTENSTVWTDNIQPFERIFFLTPDLNVWSAESANCLTWREQSVAQLQNLDWLFELLNERKNKPINDSFLLFRLSWRTNSRAFAISCLIWASVRLLYLGANMSSSQSLTFSTLLKRDRSCGGTSMYLHILFGSGCRQFLRR